MPLLNVSDLTIEVDAPGVGWSEAVTRVGFCVQRGEAVGLVGESGCGKSLTLLSILGLLPQRGVAQTGGEIRFDGEPLKLSDPTAMRAVRGAQIGFVPQEPMSALNPVFSVGQQVAEAIRIHEKMSRREARAQACRLLGRVGIPLPEERYRAYPHQLSGGQRQRVLLAIGLAGDPELLLADEPTTALDVTVQAQVLRLLRQLILDRALGLLLVTHDLAVVSQTCERVAILYAGQVVESGPTRQVLERPAHPYTRGLLNSMPGRRTAHRGRLQAIAGVVPGVGRWPSGCRFRDRCPRARARCAAAPAELVPVSRGRESACHFWAEEHVDG